MGMTETTLFRCKISAVDKESENRNNEKKGNANKQEFLEK